MLRCRDWSSGLPDGSGKSAPVTMAFTPGIAAAAVVSMERMRAWAWGERTIAPSNMPGSRRSAPNLARPVTFSKPSGRIGRVPIDLKPGDSVFWSAVTVIRSPPS